MRKSIRRVIQVDDRERMRKNRAKARSMNMDDMEGPRECAADRILANQAIVHLLTLKLETEGEEATISFLESLGCSDVEAVLQQMKNP